MLLVRRDEVQFRATTDNFSREHKLKTFAGQKICFFGSPADEHQHIGDVLISNGGMPAELDDPDCSHVVMPNTGGYFLEAITTTCNSPKPNPPTNPHSDPPTTKLIPKSDTCDHKPPTYVGEERTFLAGKTATEILKTEEVMTNETDVAKSITEPDDRQTKQQQQHRQMDVDEAHTNDKAIESDGNADDYYFDERLVIDYDRNTELQLGSPLPDGVDIDEADEIIIADTKEHLQSL
ncbi:uncharacterized protein [Eurosta solidaginis]|uniref:uncharacterized protein n=1 Tax=Eurosta solidaginis TaxID=178769 RepID=UPI0035309FCA